MYYDPTLILLSLFMSNAVFMGVGFIIGVRAND